METAQVNMLDGFIGLLVALLILSIINEKLSTFLRANTFYVKRLLIFISGCLLYVLWYRSPTIFAPEYKTKVSFIFCFIACYAIVFYLYNFTFYEWLLRKSWAKWVLQTFFRSKKSEEIKVVDKLKHIINVIPVFLGFFLISNHFNEALGGCGFIVGAYSSFLLAVFTLSFQSAWKGDILVNIAKSKKQSDSQKKEEVDAKSSEIDVLSLITGFFIAFAFRADIFAMFKAATSPDGLSELKWGARQFLLIMNGDSLEFKAIKFDSGLELVGILVTGFFLSFGSKFFHDLLDNLLQIKNLKRKLNDKAAYEIENVKELDQYLKLTEGEIAKKAIAENYEELKRLTNYKNVFVGFKIINGQSRRIPILELSNNNVSGVPKELTYKLPNGIPKKIPIQIVTDVGKVKASFERGNDMYTTPLHKGSYGCTVKGNNDKQLYALTCAHVLLGGNFDRTICAGYLSPTRRAKSKRTPLGDWMYGLQSDFYDFGMVKIYNNKLGQIVPSGLQTDPLAASDVKLGSEVFFEGHITKNGKGKILGFMAENETEEFQFANGLFKMKSMIKVGQPSTVNYSRSISTKGDSGAVLYDDQKRAIGMIVGFNDQYTYAIIMDWICSSFDCRIY